jgi:GTPase SAR1 family protein
MGNCIEELKRIDSVVARFLDLMGNDAEIIRNEIGIGSADSMQAALDQITESSRLLQIGIVGRVKAGKSSLLNAMLFDGQSVLPKAATPMTAALTTLAYGTELSAAVDFFTDEDIRDIHDKATQYEEELRKHTQRNLDELRSREANDVVSEQELVAKAEKRARRELQDRPILSACYDQSNRIKKSGIGREQLNQESVLKADSYDDLKASLVDFVSADGKFMPFTKSVNILLPLDVLKDVSIVDTPGINDPVESREARTRELLKYCDVILVVSPAGQFMSNEDMDLMDRIGSKEGVRELYVVASQVDTQLFGSEKKVAAGRLYDVLDGISLKLDRHLKNTISKLKQTNEEVGDTFDQLIDDDSCRVMYTSGISKTILECGGQSELMDSGTSHIWRSLSSEYPDYFSESDFELSKENLKRLSNMSAVDAVVEKVRNKKDHILEQKTVDYLNASRRLVSDFYEQLIATEKNKRSEVENVDIADIEEKISEINLVVSDGSAAADECFAGSFEDFILDLKARAKKEVEHIYSSTKKEIEDRCEDETYQTTTGGGCCSSGSTVTRSRKIVRSGAVSGYLEYYIKNNGARISAVAGEVQQSWRRSLLSDLTKCIRKSVKDEFLDPNRISRAIRSVVSSLPELKVSCDRELPDNLKARGVLRGSEAEEFVDAADNYLIGLQHEALKIISSYVRELKEALGGITVGKNIFDKYETDLKELKLRVECRHLTVEELKRFEEELNHV